MLIRHSVHYGVIPKSDCNNRPSCSIFDTTDDCISVSWLDSWVIDGKRRLNLATIGQDVQVFDTGDDCSSECVMGQSHGLLTVK